jgi:type I restriction enzyme S subunit
MNTVETDFDELYPLPAGWQWQPLEALVRDPKSDVVDGPFGSNLKASEYQDEGIPIARLQNVDRNRFIEKHIKCVTLEKASELSRHSFEPGDVLVTKLGDPLGKACLAPPNIARGVIVADLVRVRVRDDDVDRGYLTYAINSPFVVRQFEKHVKGTTRPRVNLGLVRMLPIPVAPREQQGGIVAEIEKQFSRLDEAVASLKRVKANLKRYRAAVLKAAVEGRLVPTEAELARREGRSYETGEQLLARILARCGAAWEKEAVPGRRRRYVEPEPPYSIGLPDLPQGWAYASVGLLGDVIGGLTKNPKRVALKSQLPYLRVANVYANELRLDEIEHIGVEEKELDKLLVLRGDLLIVEGNGSLDQIGRVAIWDGSINPCVHQNHLIKVRLMTGCLPEWALLWLLSPIGRNLVRDVASSTSGLYTLSVGKVAGLPVPVPPFAEQHRIVAEVDRRLSLAGEIERQAEVSMTRSSVMKQAVLHSMFAPRWARER